MTSNLKVTRIRPPVALLEGNASAPGRAILDLKGPGGRLGGTRWAGSLREDEERESGQAEEGDRSTNEGLNESALGMSAAEEGGPSHEEGARLFGVGATIQEHPSRPTPGSGSGWVGPSRDGESQGQVKVQGRGLPVGKGSCYVGVMRTIMMGFNVGKWWERGWVQVLERWKRVWC